VERPLGAPLRRRRNATKQICAFFRYMQTKIAGVIRFARVAHRR
jgi:hypothetical protein